MFAEDRNAHAMGMIVSVVAPERHGGDDGARIDGQWSRCLSWRRGVRSPTRRWRLRPMPEGHQPGVECLIEWLAPARVGDRLVAEASETHHQGRTGVYGVVVSGPKGVAAVFHGKTKRISDDGPASP